MRSIKDIQDAMKRKYASEEPGADFRVKIGQITGTKSKAPDVDMEARTVSGIITTTTPDNDGEVVVPSGLDMSYFPRKVKTVYLYHDYEKPVGKCRRMEMKDGALWASTFITSTALGEDVLKMLNEGVIGGFSIGFATKAFGPPTDEEEEEYGEHHTIHRQGRLFEYSITPMPCNPDALVSMVSKGMIHRSTAVACGLDDTPARKYHRAMPVMMPDGTVCTPIRSRA